MSMTLSLPHTLLLMLVVSWARCDDFRLIDVHPRSNHTRVMPGDNVILTCKANKYIRGCTWQHRNKSCSLSYSRTANALVKSYCRVYEDKIFPVGDYESHECSIKIVGAGLYEAGKWECHVREYITRWDLFAKPRIASYVFHIDLLQKEASRNRPSFIAARFPLEDDDQEEPHFFSNKQELLTAIIVIGSLFAIVLIAVVGSIAYYLTTRRRREPSMSLRDSSRNSQQGVMSQMSTEPEAMPPTDHPDMLDSGNEKALTQLGVLRYTGQRRVL